MVAIVIDEIAEAPDGGDVFPIIRVQPTEQRARAAGEQTTWKVWVVEMDGTVVSECGAIPRIVRWPGKNQPVEVELDMSIDDPAMLDFVPDAPTNRELQVYRNDKLLAWVKPVTRRATSKSRTWRIVGKDPLWYLLRRNIGRANRVNYLTDPGFESSGGWTASGVTFTRTTGDANTGSKYGKLVGTGAGGYVTQAVVMRSGAIGLNVYVSVWARIKVRNGLGAFANLVTLARRGQTGVRSSDRQAITTELPVNSWERYDLLVHIPPNRTETIDLTLWVGDGENHFDTCQMVVAESIDYSTNGPYDQAKIAAGLVAYAQGNGNWGLAYGTEKSDVYIRTSFANTGVKRSRVYQLADHQPIFQGGAGQGALDEFIGADDGFDVTLDITPTSRTLKSHYPKYQPTMDSLPLTWRYYPETPELNASEGITEGDDGPAWDYGESLEETANQVVVLGGWGTSGDQFATREEGGYDNPSTLGGLTLERVETAPDGAPVGILQSLANGIGERAERPVRTPVFYVSDPRDKDTDEPIRHYIGNLKPGMRVPTWIHDGTVRLGGETEYAIVASCTLNCDTDRMAVTLNEDDA